MRKTKHRRRYHTDRIVRNRRARYLRESPDWWLPKDFPEWFAQRMAYGRLASTDPWDCGNPQCGVCHTPDPSRRAREKRAWQRDWL